MDMPIVIESVKLLDFEDVFECCHFKIVLPYLLVDVSIDDIKFENCGPPELSNRNCIYNEIQCGNKNICIQKSYVCDHFDDCGDGWDESPELCNKEKNKLCTFEQDLCNWNMTSTVYDSKWQFRMTTDQRRIYDTGPLNDHTYGTV